MLEVRGLTKRYSGIPVVQNVSFVIQPGEILGYLGPNGAGKSTTIKMLTGLIEPSEGEILFRGENVVRDMKDFQRRMGYVANELLPLFGLWEDRHAWVDPVTALRAD